MIMMDRNPSPPPDRNEATGDINPDRIGETVISKHWLFQTLIRVMKTVEEEDANCDKDVIELDRELEHEMCNLWDMSADIDIAHFLQEFQARQIFLGVIEKTNSPRLLEIITGIMGNMAIFSDICKEFTEDSVFVNTILELTSTTDSPSLIQIIRVIHVCMVNKDVGSVWIEAFKTNEPNYMNNMKNIMENSLNGDLLKGVLQLVYYLLDREKSLCETDRLIEPLIIAASQLHSLKEYETLDEYWYILQLLTMQENTLKLLAVHSQATFCHLQAYIEHCCNNEDIMPHLQRAPAVAVALSVVASIASSRVPLAGIERLYDLYLSKLLDNVEVKLGRESVSPLEKEAREKIFGTWSLLRDALLDLRTAINIT